MSTQIILLLDRSGSMGGLESDVINGCNSFINEQKKLKDKAKLTIALFDDRYEVLYYKVDIQQAEPITKKEYYVRGSTALLDAMGKTINSVADTSNKKDKVLFVVNTDGLENSSHEFTKDIIKMLVKKYEKKGNWKFIFLGANIDAFDVGHTLGFTLTGNYSHTSQGTISVYNAVNSITTSYRTNTSNTIEEQSILNNLE